MSVHLVSLSSDILEDHFEQGIRGSTCCGYNDEKIGKTFDTFPQMLAYLKKNYGLSANEADYGDESDGQQRWLFYSKTVANHSDAQNGGWFDATEEEKTLWRAGKLKLYAEDYVIDWHQVA